MSYSITIIGLTITSSWGNGHATTYRGLVKALAARGHEVTFLEHDKPWYASNRDTPRPQGCRTELYESLDDLRDRLAAPVRRADFVIVGSYVPQGVEVGHWALATARGPVGFYDIDTPVTLEKLSRGKNEYISPELVGRYDVYLSFSGGPVLERIRSQFGSPLALPLYCSVDPDVYRPLDIQPLWDMGYLGTYSDDRQGGLETLMLAPARDLSRARFVVAGPQYPPDIRWPSNVQRIEHLPPGRHAEFYCSQRLTLNITRAAMRRTGYSPSVRLFEAAACGTPILTDCWPGLEELLAPGREILTARDSAQAISIIRNTSNSRLRAVATAARHKVLSAHTAAHRCAELETVIARLATRRGRARVA
jgi:spore maturation protein CgeB